MSAKKSQLKRLSLAAATGIFAAATMVGCGGGTEEKTDETKTEKSGCGGPNGCGGAKEGAKEGDKNACSGPNGCDGKAKEPKKQ